MSKNSYNAVVYYEKYGFQTRLAYNWRSKFLTNPNAWGGASWIADYGQLDASASYEINSHFTVYAEASNLTNKRYWGYVKREDQVNYLERFGTQIAFGIKINSEQEAENIIKAITSDKFNDFLGACVYSGFYYSYKIFNHFKKDFWREFI
jgi:hypothetical protein